MLPMIVDRSPRVNPAGPGNVRPFAKLPHDLAADPRLSPVDVTILLALVFYARDKPSCWPSDRSIGERVRRSRATVQRRLRHLESLGLIAREKTDANPTGRVVKLLWCVRETPPVSPAKPAPVSPVRSEWRSQEKETPATSREGTGSRAEGEKEPLPSPSEVRSFFADLRARPKGDVVRGLLAARRRN